MYDSYQTIARPARIETKVKGSRFIAETMIVSNVKEAIKFVKSIRKQEHAASHHCYAYRIGVADKIDFKYSDDGEPSGTAGKPIYDCIIGRELTNVIVVVTRYFGGTKLGTGGLARAYSDAAIQVLEKSQLKTAYITDTLSMRFEVKYYDKIIKILSKLKAEQQSSDFSDTVKLTVAVRQSKVEQLKYEITNLTHGQAQIS